MAITSVECMPSIDLMECIDMAKALPARETLIEALSYDPETGSLMWKVRPVSAFTRSLKQTPEWTQKIWNAKNAGRPAFTLKDRNGHCYSCIDGASCFAHRVIWKMVKGVEPETIDHIHGDPSDNRLVNLRNVSQKENSRNGSLRTNNTSGFNGVTWLKRRQKYLAVAQIGGKKVQIGSFKTAEEANIARLAANPELGFHENHGRRNDVPSTLKVHL